MPMCGAAWIAVEGIEGSGKTYLLSRLEDVLPPGKYLFVREIPKVFPWNEVISIIGKYDDEFFRTGHPISEMLLFIALKIAAYQNVIRPALARGLIVFEDRSALSNVAYGAAIQSITMGGDPVLLAEQFLHARMLIAPMPDYILLICDDFRECISRAEHSRNRSFSPDEREIVRRVYAIYDYFAGILPNVVVFDRHGLRNEAFVDAALNILREMGVVK